MLTLIQSPVAEPDVTLAEIPLLADRLLLAKRRWRGRAADGREFGFELSVPLQHGDCVFESATGRYVVRQRGERVLEISLDLAPAVAAGIGWAIGNLHLELSAEPSRLLTPDEPATRALLERLKLPFRPTTAIFRAGHFARRNQPVHELGMSHRH